jgi:hypothetical protein
MRLPTQANPISRSINTARMLDVGIVSSGDCCYNLSALPGGILSVILAETNPITALIAMGVSGSLIANMVHCCNSDPGAGCCAGPVPNFFPPQGPNPGGPGHWNTGGGGGRSKI